MSANTSLLLSLWRETRTAINHFDDMMDKGRQRAFLIFATITSIAATLHYTLPDVCLYTIRLSALLEICAFIAVFPFFVQNRLYHNWLRKSINTALKIEIKMSKEEKLDDIFLTSKLNRRYKEILKEEKGYWKTMLYSKLFWIEVFLFLFILAISILLIISFQLSLFPITE